jgi:hypothetical protein
MKQPRKDVLREQLALAADEIIRLREDLALWKAWEGVRLPPLRQPWWRRWFA